MRHIPNILTIIRLLLAFIYPVVSWPYRIIIFFIALFTEWADGALSRALNAGTTLGALLDPIADKAFILSVAITTWYEDSIAWWQLICLGSRDIMVAIMALWCALKRNWSIFKKLRPRWLGKAATSLQFAVFLWYLLFKTFPPVLLYMAITTSFIAGLDYIYLFFKRKLYR